jgi:hypothetical protein
MYRGWTMSTSDPQSQSIATNGVEEVTPWAEARDQFANAPRYWLATVRPDGRPHVMPLFGVWLDDALYFTANAATRKARNLASDTRCVIAASGDDFDLIVEGEAGRERDEPTIRRIADLYDSKYGWSLTVRDDGAFDAPFGAPSAGPPPYEPYRFDLHLAFGLGMTEPFAATKWRFPDRT